MIYSKKEIIIFLELYSISKIKKVELEYKNTLDSDYTFYSHVIEKVENWLTFLDSEEIKLIEERHIQKLSFDQISINHHYANHSSIVRKYNSIIDKIKNNCLD